MTASRWLGIGRYDEGPVLGFRGGPSSWCWRPDARRVGGWRRGYSAVTSVTAARAADSSTIVLLAAKVATRACSARLLTARGSPRLVWWIRVVASSLNSWSLRPTSLRWWRR